MALFWAIWDSGWIVHVVLQAIFPDESGVPFFAPVVPRKQASPDTFTVGPAWSMEYRPGFSGPKGKEDSLTFPGSGILIYGKRAGASGRQRRAAAMKSGNNLQGNEKSSLAAQFDVVKLGHIDSNQASFMLSFLLLTKVFLALPSFIIRKTGTGAWITMALSAMLASVGLWGWLRWSKCTGNLGVVPSLRLTLGRILGDIAALFMALYFVIVTSLSVRVFSGGAVIALLPEFPIEILISVIIAAALYSAWLGLESVGRSAVFFFPIVTVSIIVVVVGSYRLFDIRHLHPLFGMGVPVLIRESLPHTGLFGAISVTAVLKSYLRQPHDLPRFAYRGLAIAAVFMIGSVVLISAVFPYPVSTRQIIPLGTVARAVYLGRFLQVKLIYVYLVSRLQSMPAYVTW